MFDRGFRKDFLEAQLKENNIEANKIMKNITELSNSVNYYHKKIFTLSKRLPLDTQKIRNLTDKFKAKETALTDAYKNLDFIKAKRDEILESI